MIRWKKRIRKLIYIFFDILSILLAYFTAQLLYFELHHFVNPLNAFEQIGFIVISSVVFTALFLVTGHYEEMTISSKIVSAKDIIITILAFALIISIMGAVIFYTKASVGRRFLVYFIVCFYAISSTIKVLLKIGRLTNSGKIRNQKNIVVVGQSAKGITYIHEVMKHQYLNYQVIGYVSINAPRTYDGIEHLGNIDQLEEIAKKYVIDEITVVRPLRYDERLKGLLDLCQIMGITVNMILDYETPNNLMRATVAMNGPLPTLKFHMVSLNETQMFMKRFLDVTGALVGMLLFGIAFIIVGPLIKLESPGPVIFKQDRVGKNGRVFKIWKFRSMGVNAEKQKEALMDQNEMTGHMFKLSNDPRITKIGAFIRKTSIDELPQFYNVLKGDMSLVGTRPPTVKEVEKYDLHHHCRIATAPGITGMWQISGRSDIEDFEEIVKLDREYIASWSIWLDIKILWKTILVVLLRRGSK